MTVTSEHKHPHDHSLGLVGADWNGAEMFRRDITTTLVSLAAFQTHTTSHNRFNQTETRSEREREREKERNVES